jgi:D-alanyl-D-alanine carboxypeptidase
MGVWLGVADWRGFIGHTGVIFGYTSWMGYQPQNGATIIVLANLFVVADHHTGAAGALAQVIQQELFP